MSGVCSLCPVIGEAARTRSGSAIGEHLLNIDGWPLLVLYQYAVPGWYVLAAPRHVESFGELSVAELQGYGTALGRLDRTLRAHIAVTKTYLVAYGEEIPHLHVLVCAVTDEFRAASGRGADLVARRADLINEEHARAVAATVVSGLCADPGVSPRPGRS